ncbi:MAG: PAS domain-containing protein, partial [Planctomycetota bacterium]
MLGIPGVILIVLGLVSGWAWVKLVQAPAQFARERAEAVSRTLAGSLAPFAADAARYRFDGISVQLASAVANSTDGLLHARFVASRPEGQVVVVASDQATEIETVPEPALLAALTAGASTVRNSPGRRGGLDVGSPVRDASGKVMGYLQTEFAPPADGGNASAPAMIFAAVTAVLWLLLLSWFVRDTRTQDHAARVENRLASAFRALFGQRVIAMVVRPAGAPAMANQAAADLLGRPATDVARTPLNELVDARHAADVQRHVAQMQAGEIDAFVADVQLAIPEGNPGGGGIDGDVHATIVSTAVRDALGDTLATMLIEHVDHHHHGEDEHEAGEAHARFRAVFHNATVGVGLFSPAGKALQINPRWATMFGFSSEDDGRDLTLDRTHPDQLFESHDLLRRLAAGEIPSYRMEARFIRRDKSEFTADLSVVPIHGGDHKVEAVAAVVIDLTEAREQADRRVLDAEARFRALFDAAPDAICVLDGSGRIVQHNRAASNIAPDSPVPPGTTSFRLVSKDGETPTLRPAVDLRGRTLEQLLPGAADILREGLQRIVAGEPSAEMDVQIQGLRDSDVRDLWLRAVPLKNATTGKLDGALVYVRDISRRREAERQLERSTMFDAV